MTDLEGAGKMTAKQALRECPLFAMLDNSDLGRIAALTSEREHEAGATIFQEGGAADEMCLLLEGKVALQMMLPTGASGAARRVTIDIATEHQVLGWSAVVSPNIYTLTAVCLQRSRLLVIDGRRLAQLLSEDTGLGYQVMMGLIQVVATRLDDTRRVLLSERAVA